MSKRRAVARAKRKENMSTKARKSEHSPRDESVRLADKVVSREEWIAARKKLLKTEKELTRRNEEGDCHGFCAEKQK
jgi:hypothetical protein